MENFKDENCSNYNCIQLPIPNTDQCIVEGNIIQLERFSNTKWKVQFGWYEYGGNRQVCGWYLINLEDCSIIRPIQAPDLYDIYVIENS